MKRKKYLIASSILSLLVMYTGIMSVYGASENTLEVSVSDIQAWATADNVSTEKLFEDLEDAREAMAEAEDSKGAPGASDLAREKSYSYDIIEAQLAIDQLIQEIWETTDELELEATKLYYNLLFVEEEMGIQSRVINEYQLAYDEVVQKYDLGIETQLEVNSALVELMKAETAMTQLAYSREALILDLNQLTDRALSDAYTFVSEDIPTIGLPDKPTSKMIDEAIDANTGLDFMYQDLEQINRLKEIYEDLNDDSAYNDELATTRLAIEEQTLAIADEIRGIEVEILTTYNSLLIGRDDLRISELNLESLQIDLTMAEEQLDLGMVTEAYVASIERAIRQETLVFNEATLANFSTLTAYEWLFEGK